MTLRFGEIQGSWLGCKYCSRWHALSDFSSRQQAAPLEVRYCMRWSSSTARAEHDELLGGEVPLPSIESCMEHVNHLDRQRAHLFGLHGIDAERFLAALPQTIPVPSPINQEALSVSRCRWSRRTLSRTVHMRACAKTFWK